MATPAGIDPVWLAQSRLRRRKWDQCTDLCSKILSKTPYDQAVWYLKCRALTSQEWLDDTETEEQGIAETLFDESAVAQSARPGTSFARPLTGNRGASPAVRPMANTGRPLTGFARPGTSTRPGTGAIEAAFQGGRPGTSRPLTSGGRFIRIGTASMLSDTGGPFINLDKLDLRKYALKPNLARVLCDYMLYHEHNPKKAMELCAHASVSLHAADWWWKARLGKCCYQLGMIREAEKHFLSALDSEEMVTAVLELGKVYTRLDQPQTALQQYKRVAAEQAGQVDMLLGQARIHDAISDIETGVTLYKEVLRYDASNIEAIACLGSYHFYSDQPEVSMMYLRRILQMGVSNTEVWNNLGLCCFYASQYDMALRCFDRALAKAATEEMADIWYNIGHIGVGIGDTKMAHQAFSIAVAMTSDHAESLTNLGALEVRQGNDAVAMNHFRAAQKLAQHSYEPWFNGALVSFRAGNLEDSYRQVQAALEAFPEHYDSQELLKQLQASFVAL